MNQVFQGNELFAKSLNEHSEFSELLLTKSERLNNKATASRFSDERITD